MARAATDKNFAPNPTLFVLLERTMRFVVAVTTVSLLLATGLAGCVDDPIVPGSVTAKFSLFPKTCMDLRLAQIRVQVRAGDGTIENENTIPCPAGGDGEVLVDPVPPGTYTVVVDGLSDETTPRPTHAGKTEKVVVTEGNNTVVLPVTLTVKPGSVHVRWQFADSFDCIDNEVSQVEVKLLDDDNIEIGTAKTVPCVGTSFVDPEDDKEKSGVLFEDISPTEFDVVVRGFNAAGDTFRQGVSTKNQLDATERKLIVVTLEPIAVQ